jgi:iron complex transport system substrate-binding protein
VIIWASQTDAIANLESKNIPVYSVFIKNFDDVYKEISDFGKIFNKTARADSLINYTKKQVSLLNAYKPPAIEKVYFMWPQGLLETSGRKSSANELIEISGAVNVCNSGDEHIKINIEKLVQWNPDIIVMWYNTVTSAEDIIKMKELAGINAVKNQRVYMFPGIFYCDFWTLKFQLAAKMLAKWCYPEYYSAMNIENEKREMILSLYGKKGERLFIEK